MPARSRHAGGKLHERPPFRCFDDGNFDPRQDLVGIKIRSEQGYKKVRARDRALSAPASGMHHGVERHQRDRHVRGRIGVANAASDGTAISDCRMPDQRNSLTDQRDMGFDQIRGSKSA